MKKYWWVLALAGLFAFGYLLFREATKPLPGEAVPTLSRDHLTDISGISYNSNPPTSGPHFPVWAKPGVYDRLISDGYFIHSMEHGYVIIWYDCSKLVPSAYQLVPAVYAHDEPTKESTDSGQFLMHMKVNPPAGVTWITPQSQPEEEVALPDSFKSDSCKKVISDLSEFTKAAKRVIVAPRLNMEKPVILTAWGRIDKLDPLNKEEIMKFIKAFHNKGPEQTME